MSFAASFEADTLDAKRAGKEAIAFTEHSEQETAKDAQSGGTAPTSAETQIWSSWRTLVSGAVMGAVCGAATAVLALIAYTELNPPLDPRLEGVAQRLAAVEGQLQKTASSVGILSNEMAQSIDFDTAMDARIGTQEAGLLTLRQELEEKIARQNLAMGVGSPFFQVAVAQLRAAFYAGRPFEAELINVYTLGADNTGIVETATRLAAPARTGVPSTAALRQRLLSLAVAAGLSPEGQQSYYDYGISLIGEYTGYTLQPYEIEAANAAVANANALLSEGDVATAALSLSAMEPQVIKYFEPWLAEARRRSTAEAALNDIVAAAVEPLKTALKAGGQP